MNESLTEQIREAQEELVTAYTDARMKKEEVKEAYDQAEEAFRAAEYNLWNFIDSLGLKSLNTAQANFLKSERMPNNVPKPKTTDEIEAFKAWAKKANRVKEFFVTAIDQKSLNDLVKGLMGKEQPLPPGLEMPNKTKYISMRKR